MTLLKSMTLRTNLAREGIRMATIKDIANKTGVSMMTVSRAFNKPEQVKDSLREQIMAVAKELDYVPNQAAKSLASNKTGIIQIVTPLSADDHYFTQLFAGAAEILSAQGYSIIINHNNTLKFQHDGVIYMGLSKGEDQKVILETKKPFVIFGKSEYDVNWVDIDNKKGIIKATEHLIANGHQTIGYMGIKSQESFSSEREEGFCEAMASHQLSVDKVCKVSVFNSARNAQTKAMSYLMEVNITAIVCASDEIAFGVIEAAKELKIDVPKDLSVIGFDGSVYSEMSRPRITTVKQESTTLVDLWLRSCLSVLTLQMNL